MHATFADVMKNGLVKPFNLSKLLLRVVPDSRGKLHFIKHKQDPLLEGSRFTYEFAKEVLETLAPCCMSETRWSCFSQDEPERGAINVRAEMIIGFLKFVSSISSETQKLKDQGADSSEIYSSLSGLLGATKEDGIRRLSSRALSLLKWREDWETFLSEETKKRVRLFNKGKAQPFLEKVATEHLSMPERETLEQVNNDLIKTGYDLMVNRLVESKDYFIVDYSVYGVKRYDWASAIEAIYQEENLSKSAGAHLLVLPAAAAEAFFVNDLAMTQIKVPGPIDSKTFEALRVLYNPLGEGPYGDLQTAYEAALVL